MEEKIKEMLNNEITELKKELKSKMTNGTERQQYRCAKLFVLAKSITNNVDFIMKELSKINLNSKLIDTLCESDSFIEELYIWLYENNGDKYDMFMDKNRVTTYIEYFIKNTLVSKKV